MNQSDLDALQRLFDLKTNGVITEAEYERKKIEMLSADASARDTSPSAPNPRLGHGVSLLVGAVILFLIVAVADPGDHPTKAAQAEALGILMMFGVWLVPHSIWLLTKRGANVVLPIIALALTGLCAIAYVGNL